MANYVLGITAFNGDSACAILRDGTVIAAAKESSFSHIIHDKAFPRHAIESCMVQASIKMNNISKIAFAQPPLSSHLASLESQMAMSPTSFKAFRHEFCEELGSELSLRHQIRLGMEGLNNGRATKNSLIPTIEFYDPTDCYAASTFFSSHYSDAVILGLFGMHRLSTTKAWLGHTSELKPLWELRFPHSLAFVFEAISEYLGFNPQTEFERVMELSLFGKPIYSGLLRDALLDIKPDGSFHLNQDYFNFFAQKNRLKHTFRTLIGIPPRSHESPLTQSEIDLAASLLAIVNEITFKVGKTLFQESGCRQLCLSGNLSFNRIAIQRLLKEGPFSEIWVQPEMSHAALALGAGMLAASKLHSIQRAAKGSAQVSEAPTPLSTALHISCPTPFLGPAYHRLIQAMVVRLPMQARKYVGDAALSHAVAKQLANDKIVGWFQGHSEFSSYSCGNRSILANPLSHDMRQQLKDKLNVEMGHQILSCFIKQESIDEWIETPSGKQSSFQIRMGKLRSNKLVNASNQSKSPQQVLFGTQLTSPVPILSQQDWTIHYQSVSAEHAPQLHRLLEAFESLSGCPMLINLPFGSPLVNTPQEAYSTFMRIGLDDLVLENYHFEKSDQPIHNDVQNNQSMEDVEVLS